MTALLAGARAAVSRLNGAKSRGPKTEAGKARASQNALKHGLRTQRHVVLPDEDAAEYEAFAAALVADLAPRGPLQALLADRIVAAAWRLLRSDRIEAEIFEQERFGDRRDLGLALIRDGNGARAFPTLLRYRGAAQAEFWRSLRTLKALQAEQEEAQPLVREAKAAPAPAPVLALEPERTRTGIWSERMSDPQSSEGDAQRKPIEPEARADPVDSGPARSADEPRMPQIAEQPGAALHPGRPEPPIRPDEPGPGARCALSDRSGPCGGEPPRAHVFSGTTPVNCFAP